MASQVFNVAKGKFAYYATLPAASDALIMVLLKAAEGDDTLNNYDDLNSLIQAAGNTEADFTNYARQTLANVTVTVDDTNNRVDVDCDDVVIASAGGATNNSLVKALICYDGDTGAGTDANVIPLAHFDITVTTDGNQLTIAMPSGGFARAA